MIIELAFALALLTQFASHESGGSTRRGPPDEFFTGNYTIVGRVPGSDATAYTGRATISVEGGRMNLARCIGERVENGYLTYKELDENSPIYLNGNLNGSLKASCQFTIPSSFGVYPLIFCRIPGPDGEMNDTSGLEFYAPVPPYEGGVPCP